MSKLADQMRERHAATTLSGSPDFVALDCADALDAAEKALRDAVELFNIDPRHPMLAHALVRQGEVLARLEGK